MRLKSPCGGDECSNKYGSRKICCKTCELLKKYRHKRDWEQTMCFGAEGGLIPNNVMKIIQSKTKQLFK